MSGKSKVAELSLFTPSRCTVTQPRHCMEATLLPGRDTGWAPDFPSHCLVTLYCAILASLLCLLPKYCSWLQNDDFFFTNGVKSNHERITLEKMGTRD